jgi:hypothetical protein
VVAYVEQPPEAPAPRHAITVMTGVPAREAGSEYGGGAEEVDKFRVLCAEYEPERNFLATRQNQKDHLELDRAHPRQRFRR